jgi:hypothetical protein
MHGTRDWWALHSNVQHCEREPLSSGGRSDLDFGVSGRIGSSPDGDKTEFAYAFLDGVMSAGEDDFHGSTMALTSELGMSVGWFL